MVQSLTARIHSLFDEDEYIKEWILIGKLPSDIAEIAAEVMDNQSDIALGEALDDHVPFEFKYLGYVVQQTFFADAPPLDIGGFMAAVAGAGKVPGWLVVAGAAAKMLAKAESRGFEVHYP